MADVALFDQASRVIHLPQLTHNLPSEPPLSSACGRALGPVVQAGPIEYLMLVGLALAQRDGKNPGLCVRCFPDPESLELGALEL